MGNSILGRKKGRDAEVLAKSHFEAMGYRVEITTGQGPDLKLFKGAQYVAAVEVKSVSVTRAGTMHCGRIAPKRVYDDLVAVVLPDKTIQVVRMGRYLEQTNPKGSRNISRMPLVPLDGETLSELLRRRELFMSEFAVAQL